MSQVVRMIGYAVGEVAKPLPQQSEDVDEEEEEEEEPARWEHRRGRASCYEVVTAWVHPRYMYVHVHIHV